jgi:hypothetical protein
MKRTKLVIPATLFAAGTFANPAQAANVDITASNDGTGINLVGDETPEYYFYLNGNSPQPTALTPSSFTTLEGKYFAGNVVGPRSETAYYPNPGDSDLNKVQNTGVDGYYGLLFTVATNSPKLIAPLATVGTPTQYQGYALVDDNGTHISQIDFHAIAPAVPEPATWAMMILGLGATGAMVRQRRRAEASGIAAA